MIAELAPPLVQGARTLEVRWIWPGQPAAGEDDWLAPFPVQQESREDAYLLQPELTGLSVKIRAGEALEVKAYLGSPGVLQTAGRAAGRLEVWEKWSFPCGAPRPAGMHLPGWAAVGKRRRICHFPPGGEPGEPLGTAAGCAVEITEIHLSGQAWWSLGFEAAGPAGLLRRQLETTAALVFSHSQPRRSGISLGNSQSYAEWLRQRYRL
jgi:hypothetical protein